VGAGARYRTWGNWREDSNCWIQNCTL